LILTATPRYLALAPSGPPPDVALRLRNLTTEFPTRNGPLRAVDDVSIDLIRGRVLAVIGESGSGKSALLRSIVGLQPPSATVTGEVLLGGRNLLTLRRKERQAIRGREVAMVFQDPLTALDPVFTVEQQLTETLRRHLDLSKAAAHDRALDLLRAVQIPSPEHRLGAYPFELSGGMRQRVVIAMSLACEPDLLLADEPTTALDVTVQARVMSLIRTIQQERHMSMIIVTHDLAAAAQVADDIAVMYGGRLVEVGTVSEIIESPSHFYTRGLLGANIQGGQTRPPTVIPGSPPNLARLPPGCSFAPRCSHAGTDCWEGGPPAGRAIGPGHWAACHHIPVTAVETEPGRADVVEAQR
jgi:oligopeptide/dipeptide ABC transporter ATP-binding protein